MNLFAIETGNLKLDGGAMFGVVPKSLWQKQYPADENKGRPAPPIWNEAAIGKEKEQQE